MNLYNIKHKDEEVTFKEAVIRGLGSDGGLYFPESLPYLDNIENLLAQDFVPRSTAIMQRILQNELPTDVIDNIVKTAFDFPIKMQRVSEKIYALELFWGPTLAFKDFGARFMAKLLGAITHEPITIITATSGDTGAAVAQAFKDVPNIQVAILYPHQRISALQEKLFCTLGGNIHTFAIQGDFDDCQALVKRCFADQSLKFHLNSANSINISRVLAQSLYYFEALAKLPHHDNVVICVPSGNFGNLTAGLLAQSMGLPVSAFIAATNANDTVPRYLKNGLWDPHQTIATLSNAMDVSIPNNWPRIQELFTREGENEKEQLRSIAISEAQTKEAMLELQGLGYIADPHSAIAYHGLKSCLQPEETGVFLCTAHPAKFKDNVEAILGIEIPLPLAIKQVADKRVLSKVITNDYNVFIQALQSSIEGG